jgi:predicted HAD superfamily hydrolase
LVAGASRLARLRIEARNQSERSLRDITASVVAPQLVDFVNWTLSEAIRRGLKRIYYLSRDGQVLKLLAEKIKSARGLDIDLRYLYTGRQAWVLVYQDGLFAT